MKAFYALLLAAIVSASCSKNIGSTSDSLSTRIASNVSGVAYGNCKLRSIAHQDIHFMPSMAYGQFTYYAHGNPYSLVYDERMYNGHGNYFFYYDKKTRLIELYKDGPQFPIKHRYGYNSSNQITSDTLFNVIDIKENNEFVFAPRFLSVLTYDFQGRIIKEVGTDLIGIIETKVINYVYDSRGNLVQPGAAFTYDDKVSIYRAHPVFQFINRNYSMNNLVQTAYNSLGLPLTLRPMAGKFFDVPMANASSVKGFIPGIAKVIYDCK